MRTTTQVLAALGLVLAGGIALADAPLKSALDLSTEQARQVQEIQKTYRRPFAAKRQEYNRESRKLRRARSDNDGAAIASQETIIAGLREELKQIRRAENDEIRKVLSAQQRTKFEEVLAQRKASVGSSRDAKLFEP